MDTGIHVNINIEGDIFCGVEALGVINFPNPEALL